MNSGGPPPGVTLSQLCCGALLPSLCCANVLAQWQSPISLVTLERNNELRKDLLASSKVERKNCWLSNPAQRGKKIEPISVHKEAWNSEGWHFCRFIPCCVQWIHNFLRSSRRTIHTKQTHPQTGRHAMTLSPKPRPFHCLGLKWSCPFLGAFENSQKPRHLPHVYCLTCKVG